MQPYLHTGTSDQASVCSYVLDSTMLFLRMHAYKCTNIPVFDSEVNEL